MKNIAEQLYFLMVDLSGQKNKSEIRSIFINTLNGIFEHLDFQLQHQKSSDPGYYEISSGNFYFDTLHVTGKINAEEDLHIRNVIQLYAQKLENAEQDVLIKREKSNLEQLIDKKTHDLKESQERYRAFINQINEGVYRLELKKPLNLTISVEEQISFLYENAYLAECNATFSMMYGYPDPNILIGKALSEFHNIKNHPENKNIVRRFIESGYRVVNEETIEPDINGNNHYFSNNTIGIIKDNKLVRMWGTQVDISEKRKTDRLIKEKNRKIARQNKELKESNDQLLKLLEELLSAKAIIQENEKRLKQAQHVANMGSWEMDLLTREIIWSDEMYRICGYDPGSFKPTPEKIITLFHPDDREEIEKAFQLKLSELKDFTIEHRIIRPDGNTRFIFSKGEIFTSKDGKSKKLLGSFLDLTKRKKAEIALKDSEEKYRILFDSINDGVYVNEISENNLPGLFIEVNQAACKLFGYSKDELYHMTPLDLDWKASLEEIHTIIERLSFEKNIIFEASIGNRKGDHLEMEVNSHLIRYKNQDFILSISRDITERKQAEENLKLKNDELLKANQELDNFVYRVSHDLRAPISSSLGLAEILQKEKSLGSIKDFAVLQAKSLKKLDNFIQDIVNISKNARTEIRQDEINFQELVEGIFDQLDYMDHTRLVKKDIQIEQEVPFHSDQHRLTIVLNNLISNAIKFSEDGEVTVGVDRTDDGDNVGREEDEAADGEDARVVGFAHAELGRDRRHHRGRHRARRGRTPATRRS